MNLYDVIKRPIITEKAVQGQAGGCYVFEVARGATKTVIREAVEKLFSVTVTSVHTIVMPSKHRRSLRGRGKLVLTSPWKKAIVTLGEGQTIDITESA
ncbi:MAG: 50S ribosomal protein L23 [Deltaproteobacteria bacterium]|nr:50S ribosomal protein L23 [Deltaproteobacteria bacterium]